MNVMGTALLIRVPRAQKASLQTATFLVNEVTSRLHPLIDPYRPRSEVSQLNRIADTVRMPVSRETYALLKLALEYNQKTGGAFDITVAPLARLWGFQGGKIPEQALDPAITRAAQAGVGSDHIQLFEEGAVKFTSSYTGIHLLALGRHYAVDLCTLRLRQEGLEHALINLGGQSIRCLGRGGNGEPWRIPFLNPSAPDQHLGTVEIADGQALAVSYLYEDFVMIDGQRYGHILDPRTGRPAEGTLSAVVISSTATEAGALAHALVVLGRQEGVPLLDQFPKCHVLIIPDREPLELWMSDGFQEQFTAAPLFASAMKSLDIPGPAKETAEPN